MAAQRSKFLLHDEDECSLASSDSQSNNPAGRKLDLPPDNAAHNGLKRSPTGTHYLADYFNGMSRSSSASSFADVQTPKHTPRALLDAIELTLNGQGSVMGHLNNFFDHFQKVVAFDEQLKQLAQGLGRADREEWIIEWLRQTEPAVL